MNRVHRYKSIKLQELAVKERNVSIQMDSNYSYSILLIDENEFVNNLIARFLESAGFKIYIANNSLEGIELAKAYKPSLILCNTNLSGLDGFDVLKKLSENVKTSVIPFILLAARPSMDEIKRGMTLGADSFIIRPFSAKELITIINRKLDKIKLLKEQSLAEYVGDLMQTPGNSKNESVIINTGRKRKLVKKSDIEYITAKGPYTNLFIVGKGKVLVRKLLKEWEKILVEEDFLKIHRSTIINTNYIKDIEKYYSRSLKINMQHSNQGFITSQRYTVKVRARLKN